jgi:hypothetical protein
MSRKHILLLAVLVPSLALVACKRTATDETTPPSAATTTPPADTTTPPEATTPPADTGTMPPPEASATPPAPGTTTEATPATETPFADLDKNHDGSLTKDELPADEMLSKHFSVADTNGDGKLSEAEAAKHRADMAAKP